MIRPSAIAEGVAGWSWGCVSAVDSRGRTTFVTDAHRDGNHRFIVRADEKLTAFLELESAIRAPPGISRLQCSPSNFLRKARRNSPLKLRRQLEVHERGRPRFGACFGPKEIKVALNCAAASELDLKRLEPRVLYLHPSTILAVLNPRVVHLQLPLGGYDIIGAETFVKQISEDAKFPIITGIINQSRLWENAFQTELIGEEPDQATAGGDYRIRIERATDAEHAKDFIFLERESEKGFPRYIEIIPVDVILEIDSWINLDTGARMIVHYVFQSQ